MPLGMGVSEKIFNTYTLKEQEEVQK